MASLLPYILPYFAFGLCGEFITAEATSPLIALCAKVLLPAALLFFFAARGSYPELARGWSEISGISQDLLIGALLILVWVLPYLFIVALRPDPANAFDPGLLGEGRETLALAIRFSGFALVTPFMEELFIRSFLVRVIDAYKERRDFEELPIARFTALSFWGSAIFFTLSHATWEWPVAILWVVLSHLWFRRRGNMASVIVLHAASNAALFFLVVYGEHWVPKLLGESLSLWFFL